MAGDSQTALVDSRAARITLVMSCLFATTGVTLVFLPRWLEVERGLSGAEIGAVLSLAQAARIVIGPLVAFWADGAKDRRVPMQILAGLAVVAYAGFFFLAPDFWTLLAFGFVAISLVQSLVPLVEAATLRATATGKFNYGRARGIGSVAFILSNVLGGVVVARFGVGAIVVWVLAGLAVTFASAMTRLQPDPAVLASGSAPTAGNRMEALTSLIRSRRFVLLLITCGLIQSAHGFYYNFSTLVWRGQGVPAETVGLLWGFGVAVEVAFLWSLAPIERRVSPEAMILAGAIGGALRWLLLGFAPTGFVLWPIQTLHMLSFAAAHVGAMRLIYREAPEASAGMAQTLYSVMTGGVLMAASTMMSGVLYDTAGARGYWAMAVMAAVGALLCMFLLEAEPRRPKRAQS